MRNTLTDISFLLDRTGSMEEVRCDTIGGFNAFLKDQQQGTDDCAFTLVQFDSMDPQEVVHHVVPIGQVKPLTQETFVPRSTTPLLDALATLIISTGERLAAMPEADRPGKVIVVILTDGLENASERYTRAQVMAMIQHQTEVYGWQFVFLGADQDAIAEARAIGIAVNKAMTFDKSGAGVEAAYRSSSHLLHKLRGAVSVQAMVDEGFEDSERAEQDQLIKAKKGRKRK